MSIAIVVAMEGEAQPIVKKLNLQPVEPSFFDINPKLNLGLFSTTINGNRVSLIVCGKDSRYGVDRVGTQFAARVATIVCEKIRPDVMISAGTAGGLQDAEIGDVYVGNSQFVYCDRIISLPNTKYPEYGIGFFPFLSVSATAKKLGLKEGTVATASSLDPSARDLEQLVKLNAHVVDMEAAAHAEVAMDYGVQIIAVKAITNFLDKKLHAAFEENYALAVHNLADKVSALAYLIFGKYPSQL